MSSTPVQMHQYEDIAGGIDIVIPVFNQLHYTQQCLASLLPTVGAGVRTYIVDNGSTDGTDAYLAAVPGITVIANSRNMGCAAAWNQGVRAGNSPWVAVINNDVIFPPGWLEGLLDFARETGTDIVCPALREGERNYDVIAHARQFMARMGGVSRNGEAHGVCFLVKRLVFEKIGYFDENFTIGGSEDTDFFWRARLAGFRLATTGRSFLHHYGGVTQEYIKAEILGRCYGPEHRAHFRQKWRLTWWKRFWIRRKSKLLACYHTGRERIGYGHTLREKWIGGRIRYY